MKKAKIEFTNAFSAFRRKQRVSTEGHVIAVNRFTALARDFQAMRQDLSRIKQEARAAEEAVGLESEHFDPSRLDPGRLFLLYRSLAGEPFELARWAADIARRRSGKYDRAYLLTPRLKLAGIEGGNIAVDGRKIDAPPAEVAPQLREIRKIGDDMVAAFEYAITGTCSDLQRERRIFALLYHNMCRAHEWAKGRAMAALPPQLPNPLSIAMTNHSAGRTVVDESRSAAGRRANVAKGRKTADAVISAAARRIADRGALTGGGRRAIAEKVGRSERHVNRVLNKHAGEIERLVADIQRTRHSKNSDMPV